jgi:hypothetical protein
MTLERTDVIKSQHYDRFYFQVFRQPPKATSGLGEREKSAHPLGSPGESEVHKDSSPFYKSRATILDHPAWRDDPFTFELNGPGELFILQIIGVFTHQALNKHPKKKESQKLS